MINQLIATYAADALQPLRNGVITRLAGLVKTLETDAFTNKKTARFPIPVESSLSTCASSGRSFPDLVPTSKERLIVYFEDGGATANGKKWTSKLRLVGWGSSALFPETDPAVLPALLIAHFVKALKRIEAPTGSPIASLDCQVLGTPAADTNLFSKYTYSETRSQYLLAPYFAFGLDLQLTYILSYDCLPDLVGRAPAECA